MEQSLIDATERYAETIRNTDVYKTYQGQLFLIRQNPEKYQRVNEFRRKNYELQQSDGRDMDERIEALAEELERFREDPVVDDFFRAELAFCRMMQEVNLRVTEAIDFDMEFPLERKEKRLMNGKYLVGAVVEAIIKAIVLVIVIMFVFRAATSAYEFGYRVFADQPVSQSEGRTITVGVAEDADIKDVAQMLEEKGLIEDARLFCVQELLSGYHDKILPGIYDLSTSMTAEEMLAVMSTPVTAEDNTSTDGDDGDPEEMGEEPEEYYEEGSIEEGAEGMVTE